MKILIMAAAVSAGLSAASLSSYSMSPRAASFISPGGTTSQHVAVSNTSAATTFNVTTSDCSGVDFFLVNGGTQALDQPVANGLTLTLNNVVALATGAYSCNVVVTNPNNSADRVSLPVTLSVNGGAGGGQYTVSTDTLSMVATLTFGQHIEVSSSTATTFNATFIPAEGGNWLLLNASAGPTVINQTVLNGLVLSPNPAQLPGAGGNYSGTVVLSNPDGVGTNTIIRVFLTVRAPKRFLVSGPALVAAGALFRMSLQVLDANDNTASYAGMVHLTSSDPNAVLYGDFGLSQGIGFFYVTFHSPGAQTVTVTDTADTTLKGVSNVIQSNRVAFSAVGVTPSSGIGAAQSFTFTYSDPSGFQDLNVVNILINSALDGRGACYLAYSRPLNVLYLVNDEGTGLLPGLALNGSGNISNGQCTVNGIGSSASGGGNILTLILNLSFSSTFGGNKVLYLAARDLAENSTGWQSMGTWAVSGAPTNSPYVESIMPAHGTTGATFRFTFGDTKGWQDLGVVNILINNFLDGRQACYLAYSRPTNSLYLVNDPGTALLKVIAMNGFGYLENRQCSVTISDSSAVVTGNTLTLTLSLSFPSEFAGNRVIYLAARDLADVNNSGWQAMGTWTMY